MGTGGRLSLVVDQGVSQAVSGETKAGKIGIVGTQFLRGGNVMNQVSPTYYLTFFLTSKAYSDTGLRYRDLGVRYRTTPRTTLRSTIPDYASEYGIGLRLGLRYVNRTGTTVSVGYIRRACSWLHLILILSILQ